MQRSLARAARLVKASPTLGRIAAPTLRSCSVSEVSVAERSSVILQFAAVAALSLTAVTTMSAPVDSVNAKRAEELYNTAGYDRRELLQFLKEKAAEDPQDASVLWRLARAAYDVGGLASTPAAEKKELIYYAHETIQKALAANENDFAVQKWSGIILSSIGDYEGTKVSLANSYIVKAHWEKAVALNPTDSTSHHLLGRWSLTIADISWIERKVAAALFGTPPQATYAEALAHFVQADTISPGFWKKNTFMIAQVYQKMGNAAEAKTWVAKALAIPTVSEEDAQVQKDAEALAAKLG
ncbi:regulator of microtubule dynamics protein [Achlya hypogyna]|uniref:Regulator of microtubule dynamics protein 1 n=1 Tax=Achlya hypogyna TaxID=1202772 RepID=A0A1V9ZTZ9_ACHHY|nr:regulator of microtubule dynamics protein [Achlya hypogyna]